jgi:hypothetical protein
MIKKFENFDFLPTKRLFLDFNFFFPLLDDVEELKEDLPIEEWFNIEENYSYKGTDCLRYLIRKCQEVGSVLPKCIIHSANPDGCDELKQLIDANI